MALISIAHIMQGIQLLSVRQTEYEARSLFFEVLYLVPGVEALTFRLHSRFKGALAFNFKSWDLLPKGEKRSQPFSFEFKIPKS